MRTYTIIEENNPKYVEDVEKQPEEITFEYVHFSLRELK
jgi:hypothetical protein